MIYFTGVKNMKTTTLLAAMFASTVAFSAQATTTNLVVNGSFEDITPHSPLTNSWDILSSLPGWSVANNGVEIRNNVAGVALDGNYYVELDTTRNSSIWQYLNTTAGQTYSLNFAYSPREGVGTGSNGIRLNVGNIVGGVATGNGAANTGNVWENYSYTFTAVSSNTKLMFTAVGQSDSYGGSLDNVSVSAVPEANTYAMMLVGIGLIGFVARRRRAL
ncbi:protein of unknown function DUF1555 [Methylotenera mobilis JLW8]|uniref:PEP-CTERM protein-sorting domain-containing protein n=2 Tax=Methylotenera mobilis TaxID=359408 RepID=C6WXQ8_METML|nr:protein of unknown function DUF1555 [Methylotenera mobilis JLW8]